MFGSRPKRIRSSHVDSIIGERTELTGDLHFSRDLAILGTVRGNVIADDGADAVLNISETGRVEGEIRVPNVVVNGVVTGDVYATERIQLAANARIDGNVYYHLIEMEMGAEVNGALVHMGESHDVRLAIGSERAAGQLGSDERLRLEEPDVPADDSPDASRA